MDCKKCKTEMEEINFYEEDDKEITEFSCATCGWVAIEYQCVACRHVEVVWEK